MHSPHPLVTKIERSLTLTNPERQALDALPIRFEVVKADQAILREGDQPTKSFLLVDGFACSSKVIRNGGRQIVAFHIAEDMPDLTSLHLDLRDCDTWPLTDATLGYMEHRDLHRLCDGHPRLTAFLWRTTLVDAAIHREWTVNMGTREGDSRMAHIFCEMMLRMATIGQTQDGSCALPITQADLGEATGMSLVHVNRILQELRGLELISFARGQLTIHDWDRLVELADFRTDYLHFPATRTV